MRSVVAGDYIGKDALGYMVNAALEKEAVEPIKQLQEEMKKTYGSSNLWATPTEALHITLLDWIAPLVDYASSKEALFKEVSNDYDRVMTIALEEVSRQTIAFDRLLISPTAIAVVAADSKDRFNAIRNDFLNRATLIPGTKAPPQIVHATIARFVGEIDIQDKQEALHTPITTVVEEFRLVKETKLPMLSYEVLKKYSLRS